VPDSRDDASSRTPSEHRRDGWLDRACGPQSVIFSAAEIMQITIIGTLRVMGEQSTALSSGRVRLLRCSHEEGESERPIQLSTWTRAGPAQRGYPSLISFARVSEEGDAPASTWILIVRMVVRNFPTTKKYL
jgi:hypothetical protein